MGLRKATKNAVFLIIPFWMGEVSPTITKAEKEIGDPADYAADQVLVMT